MEDGIMPDQTIIHLAPCFFDGRERRLAESGELTATGFTFESGVAGVRLGNHRGELVMLPFQGQQIWSAVFGGRNLTMKSMFDYPRPRTDLLYTYGGFLVHCGATAIGVPTSQDTHPLHGELPNAPYESARIVVGEDHDGQYIGLGGAYHHTIAFTVHYAAEPFVKLYAGATRCRIGMTVRNLRGTPMELMYMAHINFRPVDNGRLVYSAPCTPETVRVHANLGSDPGTKPELEAFLKELERQPEKHNLICPEMPLDPEVVLSLQYVADDEGWGHSLQVHPDGAADYIRHKPAQLDKAIRWISRNPDEEALGLLLPATAEHRGYRAEKAKGNIKIIPAGESFNCEIEAGWLSPAETSAMVQKIGALLSA
jgi:hypothetical protein